MSKADTPPIRCPRCGYNLHGIIATWADTCPLDGRCSECGLEFEWARVFHESTHPWLFEAQYRSKPVRCFFKTSAMICVPWMFWERTRLTDVIRPVGIAIFLAAMTMILVLMRFGTAVWSYEVWRRAFWWNRAGTKFSLRGLFNYFLEGPSRSWETVIDEGFIRLAAMPLLWTLLVPLAFICLPDSLRQARVRFAHLIRVTGYLIATFILILIGIALADVLMTIDDHYLSGYWWRFEFPWFVDGIPIAAMVCGVWICLFWLTAIHYYLQLPDCVLVSVLMTLLSGLIALALFFSYSMMVGELNWLTEW